MEVSIVEKYDPIRNAELVKVEDPDEDGGLTLVFQEDKKIKIKAENGKLSAEVES